MALTHPALAPTILVRRAEVKDAPAIARVHFDSWRAEHGKVLNTPAQAQPSYTQRTLMWQDTLSSPVTDRLTYVATVDTGQIVGFVCVSLDNSGQSRQGEIRALHVAPRYQHQGIRRLLLKKVAQEFGARGLSVLLVWVLAACPARRFYEELGARYLSQQDTEIGGQRLTELAYGWRNLAPLMAG